MLNIQVDPQVRALNSCSEGENTIVYLFDLTVVMKMNSGTKLSNEMGYRKSVMQVSEPAFNLLSRSFDRGIGEVAIAG